MVKFSKSRHSLAGKLILSVGLLMIFCSIAFGFVFINFERRVLVKDLVNYAGATADLINQGIQYGMLTGRKDLIQQNVKVIGMGRTIRFIRVYSPDGKIRYSSQRGAADAPPPVDFKNVDALTTTHMIVGRGAGKTLLYITPILNRPQCYTAVCHFHAAGKNVLAVLEAGFYTNDVDRVVHDNMIATVLAGGLFVLVISVFLCIILYKLVSKPVALLEAGMKRIAGGDLDSPIDINTRDEMGLLARTFNSMTRDLKRYRLNMENWTHSLEDEVKRKTQEIMKTQEELVNTEKLSSLGRMSAGIAHELNSPLTGIVTFAHLLKGRLPDSNAEAHEDLQVVIDQAERCSKIIKGLLGFSRGAGFEMVEINLNSLVEAVIAMVSHQTRFYNIKFDLQLAGGLPPVLADPNQIQQVFLNMLINASDAMNEKGAITIATRSFPIEDGRQIVETEFTDTGPGIVEADIGKIFEPFYTTKPVGKGTGLGLSVSYGIIKKHGGDILVKSGPGRGATFLIRLPAGGKGGPNTDGEREKEKKRSGN